jgi:hypothetical protein
MKPILIFLKLDHELIKIIGMLITETLDQNLLPLLRG